MNNNIFFDTSKLKSCGSNVIIGKAVRIRTPELVSIGDNVIIDDFTYISGSVDIGDYVHIGPGCVLAASTGNITLKALSGLSSGCKLYAGSSSYMKCGLDLPTIPKEHQFNVIIEDVFLDSFALIGAGGVVLPGCHLPQGFAVAAGLIVRKNIDKKRWHVLLDNEGKILPRRGVDELSRRVQKFYPMEITK